MEKYIDKVNSATILQFDSVLIKNQCGDKLVVSEGMYLDITMNDTDDNYFEPFYIGAKVIGATNDSLFIEFDKNTEIPWEYISMIDINEQATEIEHSNR